jgi:hypothetical protein
VSISVGFMTRPKAGLCISSERHLGRIEKKGDRIGWSPFLINF